jgi:Skp family chaperone for outer membrane proteins
MRLCALLLLIAAPSFADGGKVGLVKLTQAISETRDGETARNYLHAKFDPVMARLRAEELSLKGERDRLAVNRQRSLEWLPWRRGTDRKLAREVDHKTKAYRRRQEDARAAAEYEQQRLLSAISRRMKSVLAAYAQDSGYALVLTDDQVLAVSPEVTTEDITKDLVKRYDDIYAATSLDSEGRRISH